MLRGLAGNGPPCYSPSFLRHVSTAAAAVETDDRLLAHRHRGVGSGPAITTVAPWRLAVPGEEERLAEDRGDSAGKRKLPSASGPSSPGQCTIDRSEHGPSWPQQRESLRSPVRLALGPIPTSRGLGRRRGGPPSLWKQHAESSGPVCPARGLADVQPGDSSAVVSSSAAKMSHHLAQEFVRLVSSRLASHASRNRSRIAVGNAAASVPSSDRTCSSRSRRRLSRPAPGQTFSRRQLSGVATVETKSEARRSGFFPDRYRFGDE